MPSEDPHVHAHAKGCCCDHGQNHEHSHDHNFLPFAYRWFLSVMIVGGMLILLRPFIVSQMLVRVTSYGASFSYSDEIRLCKKIIALDKDNRQAWTSLGYAYLDSSQFDKAIAAFDHVLLLNPGDRGAASFELGQAYYAKGEFAKAIVLLERVRAAGPRAGFLLDADILKYRHGSVGLRSLNSMQTLLGILLECYKQTGNAPHQAEIQKEYDLYKGRHQLMYFRVV